MAGRHAAASGGFIDPTTVRLSDHFLLSDFMGCHSVYAKGYPNVFEDPDGALQAEGEYLCKQLLEPLLDTYGPMSISYGFISPDLSREIVKYQNPDIPSYHRWDKGAAADVLLHYPVLSKAPVLVAHEIDESDLPYSRMITYSESPYLCLSTQISEGERPRRAFYENRYPGKKGARPDFIKKSANRKIRQKEGRELELEHDWRGGGYPSYHGGGIQQMHHRRTSNYTMMSDFLYSTHAIATGRPNLPNVARHMDIFYMAGEAYDALLEALDIPRLSIVRAFESFRFNDYPLFSWADHFAIDFIPPAYLTASDVADAALRLEQVSSVSVDNERGVARIVGKGFLSQE